VLGGVVCVGGARCFGVGLVLGLVVVFGRECLGVCWWGVGVVCCLVCVVLLLVVWGFVCGGVVFGVFCLCEVGWVFLFFWGVGWGVVGMGLVCCGLGGVLLLVGCWWGWLVGLIFGVWLSRVRLGGVVGGVALWGVGGLVVYCCVACGGFWNVGCGEFWEFGGGVVGLLSVVLCVGFCWVVV